MQADPAMLGVWWGWCGRRPVHTGDPERWGWTHCRRPRRRRPLEWEFNVDEGGKSLAGVRVLRNFEEVPLARLIFWVPVENVELWGAGVGVAGADAGAKARFDAGGTCGAGGGGLGVRSKEGRGCAGIVIHGRSPGWPSGKALVGEFGEGFGRALESEVSALRSRVIFLLFGWKCEAQIAGGKPDGWGWSANYLLSV